MKKVFYLVMLMVFSTASINSLSAQKKTVKSITINVDSLDSMVDDEIYLEFKDSSGITGVTYSFANFYTMMSPDNVMTQNGSIQIKIVKAPPVKYRIILKKQVEAAEEEISREQKKNSDRILRKQEMEAKSKIKD